MYQKGNVMVIGWEREGDRYGKGKDREMGREKFEIHVCK